MTSSVINLIIGVLKKKFKITIKRIKQFTANFRKHMNLKHITKIFKSKNTKMSKFNKIQSHTKSNEDWKRSKISRTTPSYRKLQFITTQR